MIAASDILRILDQLPIWKTLKALPARIEASEECVAALEATLQRATHLHICELCGKPANVTNIWHHPLFRFSGKKIREITCEDGHAFVYYWKPREE